jgi:hypothetical protein
MIPLNTQYKVIKYLVKLSEHNVLSKNHENDKYIIHFLDRKFIVVAPDSPNKFIITKDFNEVFRKEIYPLFQKYDNFIKLHQIEIIENYYTIGDLDSLMLIDSEQPTNLSLQEILAKYFGSSKHTQQKSTLVNAIKTILHIDEFPEDCKDQQFISILYPKRETRFIILCENKNRLRSSRHDFIEFWYAGGRNTSQLKFIPKPTFPIFYLFDWDFEGMSIYIHIKKNYFPNLTSFIPVDYESLIEEQEKVKHHNSKWINNKILIHLSEKEKDIVRILIQKESVIEEQKILLTKENLDNNLIV